MELSNYTHAHVCNNFCMVVSSVWISIPKVAYLTHNNTNTYVKKRCTYVHLLFH